MKVFGLLFGFCLSFVFKVYECSPPFETYERGGKLGGSLIVPGTNPYQVAILKRLQFNFDILDGLKFVCGGSLVDTQWVLTSAQCVKDPNLIVKLGVSNIRVFEPHHLSFDITEDDIKIHPNYTKGSFDNDIALIKLPKPVELNQFIHPVSLAEESNELYVNKSVFISGWKRVNAFTPVANYLRQSTVKVISNEDCQKSFSKPSVVYISCDQLCTAGGTWMTEISACTGDPGAPLIYHNAEKGKAEQIGISLHPPGYCEDKPMVYTKVSSYKKWIKDVLSCDGNNEDGEAIMLEKSISRKKAKGLEDSTDQDESESKENESQTEQETTLASDEENSTESNEESTDENSDENATTEENSTESDYETKTDSNDEDVTESNGEESDETEDETTTETDVPNSEENSNEEEATDSSDESKSITEDENLSSHERALKSNEEEDDATESGSDTEEENVSSHERAMKSNEEGNKDSTESSDKSGSDSEEENLSSHERALKSSEEGEDDTTESGDESGTDSQEENLSSHELALQNNEAAHENSEEAEDSDVTLEGTSGTEENNDLTVEKLQNPEEKN